MTDKHDAEFIAKMVDAVRRAADEDYSSRIDHARNSAALGRLAQEINNMMQRLDARLSSRHSVERLLALTQFAIDRAAIGCHWVGSDSHIAYVNDQVCESLGYTRDELLTMRIQDLDPNVSTEVWSSFWKMLKREKVLVFESMHRRKDGIVFPVEITANYVEFGGEEYSCAFARDITDQKKADEEIRRLAYYDSLTNLPNRRFYMDLLVRAMRYARRYHKILAVLFIDLDGFKRINDTLGHDVGDRLLKDVAGRLEFCIRSSDCLARQDSESSMDTVSRIGGDEFIVLLNDVLHELDAAGVSERILQRLSEPYEIDEHKIHISASIGISHYPGDGDDAEVILNNADIAMYQAKQKGKNNYQFYSAAVNREALDRLLLEGELRGATERNEFILHYQPRVDIASGRVTGVEALVRWDHQERGQVSPADFIPIAEETGLIVSMGEWVLRQACAQIAEWTSKGMSKTPIAVNISRRQFEHHDLYDTIVKIIEDTGCDPAMLELEITESMIAQNAHRTTEMLRKLRTMGIKVAMDDFGTGYSSLAVLMDFPLDYLKIDRSFVNGITSSSGNRSIAAAIIAMSHSLQLKVIAEGVERQDQLDVLRGLGCDESQGFLFSRPLPIDQCEAYLTQGEARRAGLD